MRAAQGHRARSMNDWRQSVQPRGCNGRLHLAALRRGPPVLLPTGCTISWCIGDRHCCSALLSLPFFLNLVAEDEPPPVIANSFCWYQEVCRTTECPGKKKPKLQRTESVAQNSEFCERESNLCEEEERNWCWGRGAQSSPSYDAGGEGLGGSRGQSADPGRALEASTAFFPIPIVPSFHSPRLRSLQTHYRRLRFSHFGEPELRTGVVSTEITVSKRRWINF